jgi:hypothetical protein
VTNPTNTVYATKRMIGRGFKDEQTQKEMKVGVGAVREGGGASLGQDEGGEGRMELGQSSCQLTSLFGSSRQTVLADCTCRQQYKSGQSSRMRHSNLVWKH